MAYIKYSDIVRDTRGLALPNYRVKVLTSAGAEVNIYADSSGTRFTDGAGGTVNYCVANDKGKAEFYWTPATGQVLQVLDTAGEQVDIDADFADKFVIANLPGEVPQSSVTDLETDLTAINSEVATKAATADLASSAGAAAIGVQNGGTAQNYFSSVAVPIDAFTGTTDQKLTAAVAALPSTGGVVQFGRGTYEFASQHTFAKAITLRGHGFSSTAAGTAPTQIVKDAAITGPLFIFSVDQSGLEDIGIKGEAGNTGDGVAVRAGRFRARNVSVHSMGQDGIRFGQDATATNTNLMTLTNIHTNSNGRHGGYFHDGNPAVATAGANCNAGVINGWNATSNGGDGLKFEQSWWMTVSGAVVQVNTGAGINVVASGSSGSRYHTFIGGDQDESNTGGNIVNSGYRCSFVGVAPGTSFTDTGTDTNVVSREFTRFVTAKVTNILTSERPTAGPVDYTLIAKSYGNVSNGRGAGLEMQVPDGGTAARVGGRVSARQETTNRDAVYLSVNNSGTVQDVVYASANLTGFCPVTTNAFNLGHSTKEWNTIFLSSSGNGLRVNNVKVIGAQGAAVSDASGGATVDTEARAAINALLARLRAHGLIAT